MRAVGTATLLSARHGAIAPGIQRADDDADPERAGRDEGDESRQLVPPGEYEQVGYQQHRYAGGEEQQAGERLLTGGSLGSPAQHEKGTCQSGQRAQQ